MPKPKQLCPWWRLQVIAEAEVARLAPYSLIIPCVQHNDDEIVWDDECEGVGRVPWRCHYLVPPGNPERALVSILNRAMAPWQSRYDLGVTRELV